MVNKKACHSFAQHLQLSSSTHSESIPKSLTWLSWMVTPATTHSTPVTEASLLFLEEVKCVPASGPLPLLFPPPGTLLPKIATELMSSLYSSFSLIIISENCYPPSPISHQPPFLPYFSFLFFFHNNIFMILC